MTADKDWFEQNAPEVSAAAKAPPRRIYKLGEELLSYNANRAEAGLRPLTEEQFRERVRLMIEYRDADGERKREINLALAAQDGIRFDPIPGWVSKAAKAKNKAATAAGGGA